jgi:hypothetical protein
MLFDTGQAHQRDFHGPRSTQEISKHNTQGLDREGRSEGVVFVYAGAPLSGEYIAAIRLAPDELNSWAWCTTAEVRQRMRPLVARRVQAALRALTRGGVVELRCGHPDSVRTLE